MLRGWKTILGSYENPLASHEVLQKSTWFLDRTKQRNSKEEVDVSHNFTFLVVFNADINLGVP